MRLTADLLPGGGFPWPRFSLPSPPPLLCLVNPRSGGGQGLQAMESLKELLSPRNVCNLCDPISEPLEVLRGFVDHFSEGLRILVAGGDGTVCSVMAMLQELEESGALRSKNWPAIAVLPLGTGNDLARVLGWGGGWSGEPLQSVVDATTHASPTQLDRWHTELRPLTLPPGEAEACAIEEAVSEEGHCGVDFCNYFGIGVDARIARGFDEMRTSFPRWLSCRFANKALYLLSGVLELFRRSCSRLGEVVAVRCDGVEHKLGSGAQGVILCNIASYGGGAKLWRHGQQVSPHQDGKLDVVLVGGPLHLGLVQLGLARGKRLCQATNVEVVTRREMPVQADGEPWLQPPSRILVSARGTRAAVLRRDDGA